MSAPQHVAVRVLGRLDALVGENAVPISGAKPRALLTVLALHDRSLVPAADLVAVLWGDDPPRTARKALQTYVSAIRRALGEATVRTEGGGWRLDVGTTDAAEFGSLVTAARDAAARDDLTTSLAHFTAAIDLWHGPPQLPETHRGTAERTRWAEVYEAVVDDRVDLQLRLGHAADIVGELESSVAATPLRERRWEQLCLALYRAGRQGDALRAYHRAREVLDEELGVEPGQRLRRIEAAILAHDPSLDVRSVQLPATVTAEPPVADIGATLPVSPTTFIGRVDELDKFRRLHGTARLVTVVGPGGVGKTRFAVAAARDLGPVNPGGVWLVDLASADTGRLPETVAAGLDVFVPADQPAEDAIIARLEGPPALLLLDSCEHVLDEVSGLAGRLLAACPNVHIIATSRERLRAAGERVFTLRPLSMVGETTGDPKGSDAGMLFLDRVRAIDPDFDADPDLIGQVCARCDGLPLAIELAAARCASLGIDGLLAGLDDHLRLLSGAHVPTQRHRSLRAVLDWSHHLLDASEQVFFRRLGVFVGRFDLDAAVAVAAVDRADAADLIGRLTDKNLLVHHRELHGSRWRMLEVVRSYARQRLAAADDDADTGQRYVHWAATTAQALERDLDNGAPWRDRFDGVVGDLRSALAMVIVSPSAVDDSGDRLILALALARLHARSGRFTLAQEAYELAMSLARVTSDAAHLARAAMGASQSGMLFGVTRDDRVSLLQEAIAAQSEAPSAIRAKLLARLATELFWSGQRERSLALAGEADDLARVVDDDNARAHALYAIHYVTRRPDNWRDRLELARQITIYAARSGESQLELAGRAAYAVGLLEAGDLSAMDDEIAALSETADRLDHPEFQWYSAVYRLVRALVEGRFADADELAVDARMSAESAPEFGVGLFFAEAVTDLRSREPADAAHFESRVAHMARAYPRVQVWRCLQVNHLVARGSLGIGADVRLMAEELVEEQVQDGHWLVSCCLLAEAATALSDAETAARLGAALRPFAENFAVVGRVAAFRGSVAHVLGRLAMAEADPARAVAYFEQAAEKEQRIGAWPFVERTMTRLAEARSAAERPGPTP